MAKIWRIKERDEGGCFCLFTVVDRKGLKVKLETGGEQMVTRTRRRFVYISRFQIWTFVNFFLSIMNLVGGEGGGGQGLLGKRKERKKEKNVERTETSETGLDF